MAKRASKTARPVNLTDKPTKAEAKAIPREKKFPLHAGWLEAQDRLLESIGGGGRVTVAHTVPTDGYRRGLNNIVCMYIGKKIENGRPTPQDAIVIQVHRKFSQSSLIESEAMIPRMITVDGKEYPTDVEEVGLVLCESLPAGPGSWVQVEGAHEKGTFGALCWIPDGSQWILGILSNNHVIADSNQAAIGSLVSSDGDVVGRLHAFKRVILLQPGSPVPGSDYWNYVDCAVAATNQDPALVTPGDDPVAPDVPTSPGEGVDAAPYQYGTPVKKYGARTGYTTGRIYSHGACARVWAGYLPDAAGNPRSVGYFVDQLVVKADSAFPYFSDNGDSGSVIMNINSNQGIGLLFAGSGNNTDPNYGIYCTYANPMDEVAAALDIDSFADSIQ